MLRILIRAPLAVLASSVSYLMLLPGVAVFCRNPSAKANWQSRVLAIWARMMMMIIGARAEIVGKPPEATGLFVTNHLSYVDILLIAASMRTAFVAKKEVESWPVIGHVVKTAGTIFVDRVRHRSLLDANSAIATTLAGKTRVAVFAEGSSSDGSSVLPFRPSLLKIATEQDYPVNYGYLTYSLGDSPDAREKTRQKICWWGDAGFFGHVGELLMLPGFSARLVFGEEGIRGNDRKQLASDLYQRVLDQFGKYSWS